MLSVEWGCASPPLGRGYCTNRKNRHSLSFQTSRIGCLLLDSSVDDKEGFDMFGVFRCFDPHQRTRPRPWASPYRCRKFEEDDRRKLGDFTLADGTVILFERPGDVAAGVRASPVGLVAFLGQCGVTSMPQSEGSMDKIGLAVAQK